MTDSDSSDESILRESISFAPSSRVPSEEDTFLRRALQESKATYRVEEERRKGGRREDDLSSDEELEVSPPSTVPKRQQQHSVGPSLSSSGGTPHDPLTLDDEVINVPLNESLDSSSMVSRQLEKSLLSVSCNKNNNSNVQVLDLLSTDEEDDAKPTLVSKKAATANPQHSSHQFTKKTTLLGIGSDSSSDDDSVLGSRLQKRTQQRTQVASKPSSRKPISSQISSLTSSSSSSSEDESVRRRRPVAQRKRKTTATAATNRKTETSKAQKEQQRLAKQKEREEKLAQKRREREEKQSEKERQKQERERLRQDKKDAAQAEKDSKKRRREAAAQGSGKYAKQEVAVLMEGNLLRHSQLTLADDLREEGYGVHEYPSGLGCQAIQFIRKDYLQGGNESALQQLHQGNAADYQHLPVMAVVFDQPQEFLKLLGRTEHEEEDDYPALELWLRGVEMGWRAAWKKDAPSQRPRILLLLNNVTGALDKLWIEYRKRQSRKEDPPPTAEELHDATTWMLIQFQVECIHCASSEDISLQVKKLARFLAEEPYRRQVTELECVKKIKPTCHDMDTDAIRATDCWRRQLQQVPRVSHAMASSLVEYYPTARSLWLAYQDNNLTVDQKRLLLVDCCGTRNRNVKVSDMIYRIMRSVDAEELLR